MKGKKNKIPKFRANDGLTAQQEEIYGIDAIVMEKAGENVVKMDVESGKCEIEFTKASYVPLKAYKALLKIAASSLSDDDIKDYDILIRALAGEEFDEPLSQMATVKEYWLPIKFESPRVYIFKIKSFTETLPRHICMLYFGNQAYQFVIPANANDAYMHKEMSITPLFCPPFYHQKVANINVHEKFVPLGSREKTVGEKGVFHFESDPEILKNLTAYDPVTKKMVDRPFGSDQIVKLIIGKMDDELDLPIEPD
ncbi:hypothetical protein ACTJKC_01870 [Pedobacter sp. 22226]|uniref:hypothetical protein n=1 Tax=Pedobacter sp. 22226 TaxID=3453894 RepID=UPI003F86ABDA